MSEDLRQLHCHNGNWCQSISNPLPLLFCSSRGKRKALSELEQMKEYGVRIAGIKLGMMCKYSIGTFSLQNSPDPILRGVFEKLVKPDYDNLPTNDREGLRRVCANRNYAFLISPFFVRQSYGDYHCTVVEVPDAFFHTSASIIMNKKSHYKRLFTQR
jgi:hypothetical protein